VAEITAGRAVVDLLKADGVDHIFGIVGSTVLDALYDDPSIRVERLVRAERPLVVAGGGAIPAGAGSLVAELGTRYGIPAITAYGRNDAVPNDHPCARARDRGAPRHSRGHRS